MQGTIVLTLSEQACQGVISGKSGKSGKCHWRNTTLRRDESAKRRCNIRLRKVFILFQVYLIGDDRELPHKNEGHPTPRCSTFRPSHRIPPAVFSSCWFEADIGKTQRLKTGPSASHPLVHNHEAPATRVSVDTGQQAKLFLGLYPPLIVASLVTNCKIELSDHLINN